MKRQSETHLVVRADVLPERPEHDHGNHPSEEERNHEGVHDREVVDLVLRSYQHRTPKQTRQT